MMRVFSVVGLDQVFPFHPDTEAAIASLGQDSDRRVNRGRCAR